MSKILIISIFLNSFWMQSQHSLSSCDKFLIQTKVTVEPTGNQVKILTEGGKYPFKYIFYKQSGEIISKDWQNDSVSGIKQGKYSCTVVDGSNCRKTIDFEIF